jgi:hypothetical protein
MCRRRNRAVRFSYEPYLRDLLCLLPRWPVSRVLELAPAHWRQTAEQQDTQQLLAADVFRKASLGTLETHPDQK